MTNDSLGDRMKLYEQTEAGRKCMPKLPIMARIDGRSFHNFTKDLARPYCEDLHKLMVETTRMLVSETNAKIGYTQSDEITLVWYEADLEKQVWFSGKIQKMVSQLGALSTLWFNKLLGDYLPTRYSLRNPTFDARVWNVPTFTEAFNCFVWRQQDALRNSVSMAAQSMFEHSELQNKSCDEMQEMMFTIKGVNWNDYPAWAKSGTFISSVTKKIKFSAAEIEKLPPKHNARTNPNLEFERSEITTRYIPNLRTFDALQQFYFISEGR